MDKQSATGDSEKNVEISVAMESEKKYLLTFTAPKDGESLASLQLSEVK